MGILTKQQRAQLEAAYTLLSEPTTSFEKYAHLRTLLKGVHSGFDKQLESIDQRVTHLKAVWDQDLIHLSLNALPAKSERDKKRRRALLLFISSWKSLKKEVTRVRAYLDEHAQDPHLSPSEAVGTVVKTSLFAKGPLGLITLAAVSIVGTTILLKLIAASFATVSVNNQNCTTLNLGNPLPVEIPGLKLPTSLASGHTETFKVPPLTAELDTTQLPSLTVKMLGFATSFSLPSYLSDIQLNHESLLKQNQDITLLPRTKYSLSLICQAPLK